MRSICPDSARRGGSPAVKRANLRLEEPAFTQRTEAIEEHGTQQIVTWLGFQSGKRLRDESDRLFPVGGSEARNRAHLHDFSTVWRLRLLARPLRALERGAKQAREDSTMKTMATATAVLLTLGMIGAGSASAAE